MDARCSFQSGGSVDCIRPHRIFGIPQPIILHVPNALYPSGHMIWPCWLLMTEPVGKEKYSRCNYKPIGS